MGQIDKFIDKMQEDMKTQQVLAPEHWVDRAFKLNLFKGVEVDVPLYELESVLAKAKAELMSEPDMSVAKADVFIQARDEYKDMRILKAKQTQVTEFIRIAKQRAKAVTDDYHNAG